ncbi:MAG: response regulator [Bacteroidetes bacterium]|nr:response regulator [Bacteroidota bacterium]
MTGLISVYHPHRKMRVLFFLFFFSVGLSSNGDCQSPVFENLNVEDGLSQNSVLSIAQDSMGFIWMGTRYGLNRYDGHNIKVFQHVNTDKNSLPDNYVTSLYLDRSKTLWVGNIKNLSRYHPETNSFDPYIIGGGDSIEIKGPIRSIIEDKKGNIWVAGSNGLYLLEGRSNNRFNKYVRFTSKDGLASNKINCIAIDKEDQVWIGTDNGLNIMSFDQGKPKIQTVQPDTQNLNSLSSNKITAIFQDQQLNMWVGTLNNGINILDHAYLYGQKNTAFKFAKYAHINSDPHSLINNNIRKIVRGNDGKIWIGTQEGLSIFDPSTKKFNSYQHEAENNKSLSQNSIYSIFKDANGSMWVGTYFGGVNFSTNYKTDFVDYQNTNGPGGINNNVVSSFSEDANHNLWIGTEGGGLNFYDRSSGKFIFYKNKIGDPNSIASNLVKTVLCDKTGQVWAGTHGGGLNLFSPKTKTFKRFLFKENDIETLNSEIVALLEDSKGNIWVGSPNSGLHVLYKNSKEFTSYTITTTEGHTIANPSVRILMEDAAQNIWIGTNAGIYVLPNNHGPCEEFATNQNKKDGLLANSVNCIQQDSKGHIWVGTYYGGLSLFDPIKKSFTGFTKNEGLPNNNVLGILEDKKGFLWISTSNGLSKFDPQKNSFKNYTSSDGLASNEFNNNAFYKTASGQMFFGGFKGFTSFFPADIQTNDWKAPLIFTSLNLSNQFIEPNGKDGILNKDISLTQAIGLKHDQNVFTIGFALLNYIKSDKNRYAYKLEGFDKDWNMTNSPFATYTNLPPGDYRFMVRGANNDGVWSDTRSLKIVVSPPFWLTWWAYCVYALMLSALIFFIARYFFLNALFKKENELHQMKLDFFTNISHEIRTHLSLISAPVEQLVLSTQEDKPVNKQVLILQKNSDSLLKLVTELMDFRKAETGNLHLYVSKENMIPVLQDIYSSFQNMALSRNIKSSLISDTDHIDLYFDKEQLQKVFSNLLCNAFKFTHDGGQVNMMVKEYKNTVEINIVDNGIGIAPENLDKLFKNYYQENDHGAQNTGYGIGLALAKSIVLLHKGNITVESIAAGPERKENRTIFTITLLKGHEHFAPSQIAPNLNKETSNENALPLSMNLSKAEPSSNGKIVLPEKKYSVLIVEDNQDVLDFVKSALNDQYIILDANNGLKGWEKAIEQIPDIIISDIMMPEMDGLTLCKQLKTDERTSHIPVILLTAKSATDNYISGLEMGADIYLTKPFSLKVLSLHIHNQLASLERMRQSIARQILGENVNKEDINVEALPQLSEIDKEFLNKITQIIDEYMDDPAFGVDMICHKIAMSKPVLYKKLKAVSDMSVNDLIRSLRMKKAAELLKQKNLVVYEVAYMVGYSDRKYFSKEFKKYFGKTPSEFIESEKFHEQKSIM